MNDSMKDLLYTRLGSTWLLDSLHFFLIGPLGFVGFILNYISFAAFSEIKYKSNSFKKYLRVYSLSCSLVCFILMFCFVLRAPRFLDLIQNFFASIYNCKIVTYLGTSIFFFINILDCIFLLERVSNFKTKSRLLFFFKLEAYTVSFGLLLIVLVINIYNLFLYELKSKDDFEKIKSNIENIKAAVYCEKASFFKTQTGKAIILLTLFIRDILTLLIEIIFTIYSIISFRIYLNKKIHVFNLSFMNVNSTFLESQIQNRNSEIENQIGNDSSNRSSNIKVKQRRVIQKCKNYNDKLTKMTICLSIFSITTHLGTTCVYILIMTNEASLITRFSSFITMFLIISKYISNFFLFFYFNKSFRMYFKKQ